VRGTLLGEDGSTHFKKKVNAPKAHQQHGSLSLWSLWSQEDAATDLLHSVAIAVQKGNAMTILGAHAAACLRAA
jgi:hypothetical protein